MILLGAAGGDIAGSRFEFNNIKSKDFELFTSQCDYTDDTIMTMAIAEALIETQKELPEGSDLGSDGLLGENSIKYMRSFGRQFPHPKGAYGGQFGQWLVSAEPAPYKSFGNGSAMRVSACGWAARSADEATEYARLVTAPTHNHREGIKGAEATATAIFHARNGAKKDGIADIMSGYYDIDFTLDEIRPSYRFDGSCQGTVPQAIVAFLESDSYEDAVRNAVSIGGDSDTIAAIAGSIAEAYFGIPDHLQRTIISYLETAPMLLDTIKRFNEFYFGA